MEDHNDNHFDERLLPCPFCGGKAYLGFYVDGVDNYVYCDSCHIGADNFDGEDDAITKWNRRVRSEGLHGPYPGGGRGPFVVLPRKRRKK